MHDNLTADVEPRTQAERTALSDARMLEAAIALICERGGAGTTLKDVGEHAGYSRGLASYRFGNKAGLYAFMVRSIGESWLRELHSAVRDKVGLAAIEAATDAHYRFIVDAEGPTRAFYVLWFESIGPDPELRQVIQGIHARRRRDVKAWIDRGIERGEVDGEVDAQAVADHFCASIIGIVYQWLVTPGATGHLRLLHETLKHQTALMLSHTPDSALVSGPASTLRDTTSS